MAEEHGIESVAFPAISTGAFGYPMEAAADIAMGAMLDILPGLHLVSRVRFVLLTEEARELHERVLRRLLAAPQSTRRTARER